MPKSQVVQSSFTTGVIAPTLAGRIDIAKYYNALDVGENITLMPHGGLKRRAGSVPVLKSKDSSLGYAAQEFYLSEDARLEPFVFNIEQKYLIVFDTTKFYVIKDDLLIYEDDMIDLFASAFSSAFSSAFGGSYSITAQQLKEMDITQYADTMILVHPDFPPLKLVRGLTETDWTIDFMHFKNIPLYDYTNNYLGKKEIFKGNATEKEFVLIYTVPPFTVYVDGTKDTAYVYDKDVGKITFTTAPANGAVIELISGAGVPEMDADNTYEDIWSDARGYPRTVTIYQGRLFFGGTKSKPITVFGSVINDYFDFNLGDGVADMGIFDTISSGTFDDITVITSARTLQVFTESGEYYNPAIPITPASSSWSRQTGYGAHRTNSVSIDGSTYFVDRSRAAVRQFIYSLDEDAYVSPNISLLSDHLTKKVKRMAVAKGSGSDIANLVYVLNEDGTMAVLNTMRLESIQGWSRWTTQGLYKDLTVVDQDLYVLVARGYDAQGKTKYYVEKSDEDVLLDHYHRQGEGVDAFMGDYITREFSLVSSRDGKFDVFLDDVLASPQPIYDAGSNSITFVQAPEDDVEILVVPNTNTNATMFLPTSAALNYRKLSKKGNLFYEGEDTPTQNGNKLELTFEKNHSYLETGFGFVVKVRTVNLNASGVAGQLFNEKKRLVRVKINVYKTLGIKIENYILNDRKFIMDFSRQLVPFTGTKEVYLLGYATHNAVEITQEIPMPFTLLQIETEIKY